MFKITAAVLCLFALTANAQFGTQEVFGALERVLDNAARHLAESQRRIGDVTAGLLGGRGRDSNVGRGNSGQGGFGQNNNGQQNGFGSGNYGNGAGNNGPQGGFGQGQPGFSNGGNNVQQGRYAPGNFGGEDSGGLDPEFIEQQSGFNTNNFGNGGQNNGQQSGFGPGISGNGGQNNGLQGRFGQGQGSFGNDGQRQGGFGLSNGGQPGGYGSGNFGNGGNYGNSGQQGNQGIFPSGGLGNLASGFGQGLNAANPLNLGLGRNLFG